MIFASPEQAFGLLPAGLRPKVLVVSTALSA